MKKFYENNEEIKERKILNSNEDIEKKLQIAVSKCNQVLESAYVENAPSVLCSYLYELANTFNTFYQKVKILQGDKERLNSNIALLTLIKNIFETGVNLLGFSVPDKM